MAKGAPRGRRGAVAGEGDLAGALDAACGIPRALVVAGTVWELALLVLVGIAQGGVASPVPLKVRAETLAGLESHMERDERELVEACYGSPNGSGVRTYEGRPSELGTTSRLARVLAAAECADGGQGYASLGTATTFVRGEYAALGYDLARVARDYAFDRLEAAVGLAMVALALRYLGDGLAMLEICSPDSGCPSEPPLEYSGQDSCSDRVPR